MIDYVNSRHPHKEMLLTSKDKKMWIGATTCALAGVICSEKDQSSKGASYVITTYITGLKQLLQSVEKESRLVLSWRKAGERCVGEQCRQKRVGVKVSLEAAE